MGIILELQRKTNEAIAAYTEALQLDPNLAPAHHNIGTILLQQRQYPLASIKFRQAIRYDPNLALAHHNLGVVFFQQVKSAQAIAKFKQALCFNPNLKIAKWGLWLAQLQQNKRVKAVLVGVGIVALGLSIGSLLVSISLYNTNLARFLLSLNPNNAIFHVNLGFVLHNEGKLDEAMVHYQEAICLNPKNAVAY